MLSEHVYTRIGIGIHDLQRSFEEMGTVKWELLTCFVNIQLEETK